MTVFIAQPSTTVIAAGHPVKVKTGSTVTLDETREYVTAELELPMLDDAVLDDIDPRDGARAVITSRIGTGPARSFDVGIRERTVNHKKKTVTLSCASDETLLGDYAPLVDDTGAFVHQGSLRTVIGYVLGKIGASLEPGTADAPITVYADGRNMFPDPHVASLSGFEATRCTRGYDAVFPGPMGGAVGFGVALTAPGGTDSFLSVYGDTGVMRLGMVAGRTYTLSATGSVRAAVSGTASGYARRLTLWYRVGGGGYVTTSSPALPTTVGASTRVAVTVTLPPGTTEAFVRAYHGHAAGSVTWGQWRLTEKTTHPGPIDAEFFTGSFTDTPGYQYDWEGTVNASPSKRTALADRPPEALHWLAGVSGWDFLMPLTSSSGMRLFCDEARRWWLVTRDHMQPGVLAATTGNTRDSTDTITRDGDLWADGVVARFKWRGANGVPVDQTDTAGTAGKVLTFDFDRPYPGPGTAAFILNRMQGQGRSQEVVTVTNYAGTPGMEARLTMPDTAVQIGRVTRVEFGLTEGFMVIGSRGLTDTPDTAYIYGDPGIRYQDVPAGMTYNTFDWSLI